MKYRDYSIIDALTVRNFRKNFDSFADMELGAPIADTPENRVFVLMERQKKESEKTPTDARIDFTIDLEMSLIPVLTRMEMQ